MKLDVIAAHRQFARWREAIAQASDRKVPGLDFPGSIIVGGGAVRDTLLGREVRDIDVFMDEQLADTNALEQVLPPTDGNEKYDAKTVWCDKAAGIDFVCVDLDQVSVTDMQEYVDNYFRCNLSKVYFDGNQLVLTQDFIEAVASQTLRFTPHTSHSYIDKIHAKYPEFKIDFTGWP